MAKHSGKWVSYLRVSTDKQGESGLGIEAQRKAVETYLNGGSWTLAQEFVEVESGKRSNNRPQLAAALAACKKLKAKLVVAKLDRLARNVAFISKLMESGVEFVACDFPHANKLTIHILAAVAEHERELISSRTKAALAAAKERGKSSAARSKPSRPSSVRRPTRRRPTSSRRTRFPSSGKFRRAASPRCAVSQAL
jgi:DNA invertase Pin-like site-specific DNA recombinase